MNVRDSKCSILSLDMEKEGDRLVAKQNELRTKLETLQNQQSEDSRGISRQQKNTERYLAKKQMLLNRKDDCNRSIRDLGVLPEEAFEKYTNEKLDRVRHGEVFRYRMLNTFICAARQEAPYR